MEDVFQRLKQLHRERDGVKEQHHVADEENEKHAAKPPRWRKKGVE